MAVHVLRSDGQRDPVRAALRRGLLPPRLRTPEGRRSRRLRWRPDLPAGQEDHGAAPRIATLGRRRRPGGTAPGARLLPREAKGKPGGAGLPEKTRHRGRGGDRGVQDRLRRSHARASPAAGQPQGGGGLTRALAAAWPPARHRARAPARADRLSGCRGVWRGRHGLRPRHRRRGQARAAPVFAGAAAGRLESGELALARGDRDGCAT